MQTTKLSNPSLSDIAREVSRVREYCFEEQENLWNNAVRELRTHHVPIPQLLWQLTRPSSLIQIGENREFCEEARLPYEAIDQHWHDIRAAAALWYYDSLQTHKPY